MSEQNNSRTERVLDELIEAAERVGLKVRRERIMREVGYRARGGACRLRDDDMVIIDRDQPPHEQLEIVRHIRRHQLVADQGQDLHRRAIMDARVAVPGARLRQGEFAEKRQSELVRLAQHWQVQGLERGAL